MFFDGRQWMNEADMKAKPTLEQASRYYRYEPDSGQLLFVIDGHRRRRTGEPAGWTNQNGYVLVRIEGHAFRAHRVAWLLQTGEWPTLDVDHINGVRTDNRWCNLRAATRSQNLQNMGRRRDNLSGVKGVGYDRAKRRWRAQIKVDGRNLHVGRFDTKEEAAAAYAAAAEKYFGEFARAA